MSRVLNCMNCCIWDFKESLCDCDNGLCKEFKRIGTAEDFEKEVLKRTKSKTGEWIKATGMMPPEFHGHHYCSECGNFANMEPPFGNREDLSKFCPNCGAEMRIEVM